MEAMDASTGIRILSTGAKARGIVQASAYTGTNSVVTELNLAMLQNTPPDGAGGEYAILSADNAYAWGSVSASLPLTNQATPLVYGPFGTKGIGGASGGVFAILPPDSILVAYPTAATNGTVIVSIVSAELD